MIRRLQSPLAALLGAAFCAGVALPAAAQAPAPPTASKPASPEPAQTCSQASNQARRRCAAREKGGGGQAGRERSRSIGGGSDQACARALRFAHGCAECADVGAAAEAARRRHRQFEKAGCAGRRSRFRVRAERAGFRTRYKKSLRIDATAQRRQARPRARDEFSAITARSNSGSNWCARTTPGQSTTFNRAATRAGRSQTSTPWARRRSERVVLDA
jgi:hypothetical protein